MTKPVLTSFHVKRFRSLMDVKINISTIYPVVICGENNIGKTNFLRALNVFFNHHNDKELFDPKKDLPSHIYEGSRGGGAKTELTATFKKNDSVETLKITFDYLEEPTYEFQGSAIDKEQAYEYLGDFKLLFIESNNVNLPILISTILEEEGLLPLDTKRKKQSQSLDKLKEFIELSQKAIADIEKTLNSYFDELTDFDGILKDKKIQINFIAFEKLRDAIKNMTSITLFDGNNQDIASKGSGAQRAVFLALMQHISKNSKKNIIWAVDEPEAFLQPRLQKRVSKVLNETVFARRQPVILTTHSQHFIELKNLSHTHLFKGNLIPRTYARKPGQRFYEINTAPVPETSDFNKAKLIKEHLGINNNDGWETMPYNILVEGEADKKYLETLFKFLDYSVPNIIWAGGASKIGGYLQYHNLTAKDLQFKPKFVCLFDNDDEGREQSDKIRPTSYKYLEVEVLPLPRYDGILSIEEKKANWEIEDFLPPELFFSVVNSILKKEKYKQVTVKQISDRSKEAHKNKQILNYVEECCSQNNADKLSLMLTDQGRKRQICEKLCEQIFENQNESLFTKKQKNFLKELALND